MTRGDTTDPAASGLRLREIYDVYFDFVWRSLRRLGVQDSMMDDATQDVYMVVHRRLPEFKAQAQIKTWLFSIVLRIAQNYRRSARRRSTHLTDGFTGQIEATAAPESQGPLELAVQQEAAALLHKLLAQMDDEKRSMLILVELEEMTVVEAAEALHINVNTAYSRLRAARMAFEEAVLQLREDDRGERRTS
jgi:RNA polymerase sigma-70 factor (ECF subfamily)